MQSVDGGLKTDPMLMKVTVCRNGTLNGIFMKYAYVCMSIIYIKAMAWEPVPV